jgi:hypothetical protein
MPFSSQSFGYEAHKDSPYQVQNDKVESNGKLCLESHAKPTCGLNEAAQYSIY